MTKRKNPWSRLRDIWKLKAVTGTLIGFDVGVKMKMKE